MLLAVLLDKDIIFFELKVFVLLVDLSNDKFCLFLVESLLGDRSRFFIIKVVSLFFLYLLLAEDLRIRDRARNHAINELSVVGGVTVTNLFLHFY